HLAHIEAVLGCLELLGEHRHVVLAQAHDGRIAHDIDIGDYGVEQHGLLNAAQALARGLNCRLRPSDRVQILEALEQRLSELDRKTARVGGCVTDAATSGQNCSGRWPHGLWDLNCGGRYPLGNGPCMHEAYVTGSADKWTQAC